MNNECREMKFTEKLWCWEKRKNYKIMYEITIMGEFYKIWIHITSKQAYSVCKVNNGCYDRIIGNASEIWVEKSIIISQKGLSRSIDMVKGGTHVKTVWLERNNVYDVTGGALYMRPLIWSDIAAPLHRHDNTYTERWPVVVSWAATTS